MPAVGNKATRFGRERKEKVKTMSRSRKNRASRKRIRSAKDWRRALKLKGY